MSPSKNNDYVVEKILAKRNDGKGRTFYLIKWKGYSSADNTWEPENHVTKCPEMIEAFEAEESDASESRPKNRSTRSNSSPSKTSTKPDKRSSRRSDRVSQTVQQRKRAPSNDSISTNDDDEKDKDYIKSTSSKRTRQNTVETDTTPSVDSHESDALDTAKLDRILDVRRNNKLNTVEYHIQTKKTKKSIWINSSRLTEDYGQQVIDFLEEKYV